MIKDYLVFKVGSDAIVDNGSPNIPRIERLAKDLSILNRLNKKVLLVTSGFIKTGKGEVNLIGTNSLAKEQAYSSIGCNRLINIYRDSFQKYNQRIAAPILLTYQDLDDKERSNNLKNMLEVLCDNNFLPIINENDAVSTEEITFGDNDKLSSLVAILIEAKELVLLGNEDGLIKDYDPSDRSKGKLIKEVPRITSEIEDLVCYDAKTSKGGMKSKIYAAKLCNEKGITVYYGNLTKLPALYVYFGYNLEKIKDIKEKIEVPRTVFLAKQ